MRWYDYGYLEEIVVRRDDNVPYKFKEGDFPRLNLCDIKDMLLLLVQKKPFNLDVDDCQNQKDLPRDNPLDSVEVLRPCLEDLEVYPKSRASLEPMKCGLVKQGTLLEVPI
nr:hypothetical protein [Tanacetum cinerariifolium]